MLKRRGRHEDHENHERWLVSYADFITLMFAFFVVMYATAQRNPEKEKEFEKSVRKYFAAIAASMGKSMYNETDFGNTPISRPIDGTPMSGNASAEAAEKLDQLIKNEDEDGGLKNAVEEVYHDVYGVRIRVLASAIFESGSAKLGDTSLGALKTLGKVLKGVNGKIIIEGHTDDLPIKSTKYPSNWELSSDRAAKILRYLSEFHEIEPKRMVVVAYADSKPAYPNDNPKNRAKNRRIEILITNSNAY
ncbi:MAG: hypothetical protein A4S09_01795 [Proteobacteria bacterium SG_bin7]|nr:MAG: hypothetical protein A4S09_01795 [Proteobacteria bacterium SG_bin7]